ncbi:hypothetical protein VC83_00587 [Pseudogymnoascus destructans]|uniref:Uncharacterized protein n=1 Tax=Pseudogymnoascus destructans TaxID=655981 RepID=A0A177ALP2_9PEZI|nr:uncharacterized protein VC83_00587 [Pseudogymnoascus destructans]OAF62945.1 hypothetical protein VC83_00587 [Pseudogymnoascus destructans]
MTPTLTPTTLDLPRAAAAPTASTYGRLSTGPDPPPTSNTAASATPGPVRTSSVTESAQMALQLLRSSLLEEPRHSRALAAVALPDACHLEFHALDSSDPPNLVRMQNLEAAIGFTVGDLVQPPCTDCAAGYSQFAGCVRVEGLLHGSCTNCHFGGEGACCSLRASVVPLGPVG